MSELRPSDSQYGDDGAPRRRLLLSDDVAGLLGLTMTTLICEGCDEPIEDGDIHLDFNGEDWHEACFEVGGGPSYCCGIIYHSGEDTCRSCGDPL
ncbi:LIM domain-containing protein [Leekyejoonella antrihumi]|uniref:LIM zinc-binding domain-containing protein n=1 Tax=Leekyejoonella antrihumi TaxID=1660198 RepID=A0A563DQT6_9MICO|nr:LIM domain-containing protein [Leekyejoonella antrihumi]TWP32585.1 hypothetical protein FGL98_23835 [Leekyejoonella antrihumi]